jgi:FKBP12-rapamycin complex-associated protein
MRNEFLNTLERLLNVTLTDSSDSVRCTLFRNLKTDFYKYLSLEENLSKLMAALNDRDIKVRRACVELLGSLLNYNSSFILPCMTQLLSQYLSEIRLSGSQKHQEHAALLLRTLITNTKQVILPNLEAIVNILVTITQSSTSSTLVKQTLLGLSACAEVCKADILPFSSKILTCVIENLKRSSPHRRKAALKTVITLVSSTSRAIKPYSDDNDLLPLLINIIRSEEKVEVRKLAEKALGKLGALDPVVFKDLRKDRLNERLLETSAIQRHLDELQLKVLELAPSHDIYYPLVALRVLMKLLSNASSLTEELVFQVLNAVFNIFRCYNRQLSSLLGHILPILVGVSKSIPDIAKQGHFIVTFKNIASVVEDDINDFIPQLIGVIDLKQKHPQLLLEMLRLLRELASKTCYEMKASLPQIINDAIIIMETSDEIVIVESTLSLIECLKGKIDSYLYLVLPALIKTINDHSSMKLRKQAIRVISVLCNKRQNPHIEDFIARIVDCFVGIIKLESTELANEVFESLAIIAENLGSSYAVYISPVQREMMAKRLSHPRYEAAVHQLIAVSEIAESVIGRARVSTFSFIGGNEPSPAIKRKNSIGLLPYKNEIDVAELLEVCKTENLHTKEEWKDWMRRLANELLRQAPAPALRECQIIEENNNSLELFNASFVACWSDLFDDDKDQMLRYLESAFYNESIPTEVLQVLLNLAEFMEHDDHKLFDARTLGDLAYKCKAYAKALHYKEVEFYTSAPSPKIIESLISLNNLLHQHEAAYGIRMYAKLKGWGDLSQAWVSEFHRWQDADELHEIINERLMADPAAAQQQELTLMRMKCLKALSNWARLLDLAESKWKTTERDPNYRKEVASFAAAASWNLGRWEQLNKYANGMDSSSFEHCFYSAIMSIHDGNYLQSKKVLDKAWDIVDNKIPGLLRESYVRAYPVVFEAQQLIELEEVIAYKSAEETVSRRTDLLSLWNSRLQGCQQSIDLWEKELSFRPLVVCPEEDLNSWLSFAKLFMKSEQLRLAGETLEALFLRARQDEAEGEYSALYNLLFGGEPQVHPASICFVYLRYLHAQSSAGQALEYLKKFVVEQEQRGAEGQSLSKYYLQLSKWQKTDEDINAVLSSLRKSTEYDPNSVRAWHKWGLVNFEVVSKHERLTRRSSDDLDRCESDVDAHIVSAVDGFSRSIAKDSRTGQRLQDTLRLITLWFKYGGKDNIFKKLKESLVLLDVEVWLQVIPQIIARASTPNSLMRELIYDLLVKVSHHHPHSLLYHLAMAAKTSSEERRSLATQVISELRQMYPQLVEDTLLVSDELIRCAVLWKEAWDEAITEASHCAFGTNDYSAMMDILRPLHDQLNRGPETLSELAFFQAYSSELKEAESWLVKFQGSGNEMDLQQAWNLYYGVYTRLHKMSLKTIDIDNVSPKLTQARNLKAAMPGLHSESSQMVTIAHFDTKMEVFQTKQHPRRLNVFGQNGKEYKFLLKGHEDLRQDERAMQLFSLVNNLLSGDSTTNSKDLAIKRFAVVPLSPTSGLIGWVHGSDTLNQLIQEYRQRKRIEVNVERDLIRSMYGKYDQLPLYNKIEIFEYAISQTKGEDLQKILWSKSPTSEIWLERRTNYTRSLATMSMVGYILGLGDRHPSNLMLDRYSGKIIHIDFGDCFEVAMKREKCPEKVPFRLTRMMLNAMEISGTEGNFRITCEQVMNVLRQNKDSLMAMLEVFLYDPLVSWRIIAQETALPSHHDEQESADKDLIRNINKSEAGEMNQVLNKKALEVLDRIFQKLTGNDFPGKQVLSVTEQVERLINEAQSIKNLSQSYIGWCPFW